MKTVWQYLTRKPSTTDPLDDIEVAIRLAEIQLAMFAAAYGSTSVPRSLGTKEQEAAL
ncbi:hypothetical protein [Arthrobacter echini]|uniref:hypothetical protein n=1 Tax=Arthrobacter echini TaxID=1529066 RepID=UPI001455EAAC|nr:hypothetical protein [Arthrobacter echini]